MRYLLVIMLLVLSPLNSAVGQVSVQIGLPSVSIGFNQPYYPELVAVPGYPVYYAPGSDSNFFFYDGMYWVYERDGWYASSWYNGPWSQVAPYAVPVFILRVPIRYYRHPPAYFRGWHRDAPPRWGDHWGHDWERQRSGWDRWDRRSAPAPAPLPVYQRQYSGNRYPPPQQQQVLHGQHYRHAPNDDAVRRVYQEQRRHDEHAPPRRAEPGREPPHMQQPGREAPHGQPGREPPHMQPGREAPHVQPGRAPERDRERHEQGVEPRSRQDSGQERGREPDRERGGEQRQERPGEGGRR